MNAAQEGGIISHRIALKLMLLPIRSQQCIDLPRFCRDVSESGESMRTVTKGQNNDIDER